MSKEDFNYRGYLLDLGYEENEIPAEFTDEEKDQLYAQAIQGTYNAYLEQEKNLDPNASKKERVIAATKRMIDDIPEAREALGIPEEIISRNLTISSSSRISSLPLLPVRPTSTNRFRTIWSRIPRRSTTI